MFSSFIADSFIYSVLWFFKFPDEFHKFPMPIDPLPTANGFISFFYQAHIQHTPYALRTTLKWHSISIFSHIIAEAQTQTGKKKWKRHIERYRFSRTIQFALDDYIICEKKPLSFAVCSIEHKFNAKNIAIQKRCAAFQIYFIV